ncbi:hypothetical protein GALMADRAFT_593267 [Galerina marginata CBS 339.88]|uniref:Uncharacterized protein n=1 Tax=Galerina marginata (strain CBS 339.88) TaxID=685588 RepID=A0A067T4D5_GALM3|nr:hypothetical protein GALMADRAFT_593267 [Galerina marginata CBS 339.88]
MEEIALAASSIPPSFFSGAPSTSAPSTKSESMSAYMYPKSLSCSQSAVVFIFIHSVRHGSIHTSRWVFVRYTGGRPFLSFLNPSRSTPSCWALTVTSAV